MVTDSSFSVYEVPLGHEKLWDFCFGCLSANFSSRSLVRTSSLLFIGLLPLYSLKMLKNKMKFTNKWLKITFKYHLSINIYNYNSWLIFIAINSLINIYNNNSWKKNGIIIIVIMILITKKKVVLKIIGIIDYK